MQCANTSLPNLSLSETLATLAWAVAADSADRAEAERLLAAAFRLCGPGTKPVYSQVRYHAGQTYAALGLSAEAIEQFGEAALTDPRGNFGRHGAHAAVESRAM